MFEFDLQRFNDDAGQETSADVSQETQTEEKPPIPEELSGLPEEYAREVLSEAEQTQAETQTQTEEPQPEPSEEPKPQTPSNIPYARFKEKVDEVNQLKAQLAEYQRRQQPAPQPQQPQAQQLPFQTPQFQITPEISKKINAAINAEAMALTGMSKDDVASLEYADDEDPRIAQWNQGKSIAQARVYNAIQQAQINQQQQVQQYLANRTASIIAYNDFAAKAFNEPDFQAIQQFAINEFFEQLTPFEKQTIASSYLHVERQTASPAEIMNVTNYFEKAKAAFRSRNAKPKPNQRQQAQQAAKLPRVDQLNGTATTSDGQLSASDFEKLLKGDFTELDKKTREKLLGYKT